MHILLCPLFFLLSTIYLLTLVAPLVSGCPGLSQCYALPLPGGTEQKQRSSEAWSACLGCLPGLYGDLQADEDVHLAQYGACSLSLFQGSLADWLLAPGLPEVTLI